MIFALRESRSMACERLLSRVCIILLLVSFFLRSSPAQQQPGSTPQKADWTRLTPGIEAALEDELKYCNEEPTRLDVVETADVTGDGIPEALVQYWHMGAYTSQVVLMQLERGKPVLARFRKDGKVVPMEFLQGASVRNGEDTKLLPEKHAVYVICWHNDGSGRLETCGADAYVWVAKSRTFDQNETLSKQIARRECLQLKQRFEQVNSTLK